jgi:hypothetical protein
MHSQASLLLYFFTVTSGTRLGTKQGSGRATHMHDLYYSTALLLYCFTARLMSMAGASDAQQRTSSTSAGISKAARTAMSKSRKRHTLCTRRFS